MFKVRFVHMFVQGQHCTHARPRSLLYTCTIKVRVIIYFIKISVVQMYEQGQSCTHVQGQNCTCFMSKFCGFFSDNNVEYTLGYTLFYEDPILIYIIMWILG